MPKFRKKPYDEVDAFQLGLPGQPTPAPEWFGTPGPDEIVPTGIFIYTPGGKILACWGDWVVRDSVGQLSVWTDHDLWTWFELVGGD